MVFDFSAAVQAPHRMQPGLRRIAAGTPQLSPTVAPGGGRSRHLREKLAVLGAFADHALLALPGFDPGPALQALAAHAAAEHPAVLQMDGARWAAPTLGWALDTDDRPQPMAHAWPEVGQVLHQLPPAWRRTGLLCLAFAEDFAVVDARSGGLPWLAVALPSMWAPEEKIGRSFAEAHAPVADGQRIQAAAPHLVRLVTGGTADHAERWERFVWTLTAHPRLHAHPLRVDPARWPAALLQAGDDEALAAQTWWRTERQTFIPVPGAAGGTGPAAAQAVFTIRVDVTPLPRALAGAGQAQQLHDALASMTDAVLAYRGLADARPGLLRWLARRASA